MKPLSFSTCVCLALAALPVMADNSTRALVAPGADGDVLVLSVAAPAGSSVASGLRVDVADRAGFRAFRVQLEGRQYQYLADPGGQLRWLGFDQKRRRFAEVASGLRVRLRQDDQMDAVIAAAGAISARAYPSLGWVWLRLPESLNPAEAAERLAAHPGVASAQVLLRGPRELPMRAPKGPGGWRPMAPATGAAPQPAPVEAPRNVGESKQNPAADLLAIAGNYRIYRDRLQLEALVYNWGAVRSSPTILTLALSTEPNWSGALLARSTETVPALDAKSGVTFTLQVDLDLASAILNPSGLNIYALLDVAQAPEERPGRAWTNQDFVGGSLGADARLLVRCVAQTGNGRNGAPDTADPWLAEQWHLQNRGQSAFAATGGEPGEDLRMTGVLNSETDGAGVRLAIVDTGLETCHPELASVVEPGASWNFNTAYWDGALSTDPFLPSNVGGHGTAVAGIAAAARGNGLAGRGVAPGVGLRGFNFLSAIDWETSFFDALGASVSAPDSASVDIFNMSFGSLGLASNVSQARLDLFRNGVTRGRAGRGALYVKAAGNGFRSCHALHLSLHNQIGCKSANADPTNNLPYLIVVGALNADGRRASYASAGANLWLVAPAGEYGSEKPAMITTDQAGRERGYDTLVSRGLARRPEQNPFGDFISTMNGASASTPATAGALALLLQAEPHLSWREVKHILAATARPVDTRIAPVHTSVSGQRYTAQLPWVRNGAGYRFHNWYGFGALAVDAALAYARDFVPGSLGSLVETAPFSLARNRAIPDADAAGLMQVQKVSGLARAASIEAVTLEVNLTHGFAHDLGIHLISPAGTESVLNPIFNDILASESGTLNWRLVSNAFYGENPNGDWRLRIVDAVSGDVGSLREWSLQFALGQHDPNTLPGDDHGDDPEDATELSGGGHIAGALDHADDVDYFRFEVLEAGEVVLETRGNTDTAGALLDELGNVVAVGDDAGVGPNLRIAAQLDPGFYYLRVEGQETGATGGYSVSLHFPDSDRRIYRFPFFVPDGDPERYAFLRVVNLGDASGSAAISALDDDGADYPPVTLTLAPGQGKQVLSSHLETGSIRELSAGLGDGVGYWRLTVDAPADWRIQAFVRVADGHLSSVHDTVPMLALEAGADFAYRVVFFNQMDSGSEVHPTSLLRLVSTHDEPVAVSIHAEDDAGTQGVVSLTLAPRGVAMLTSAMLELGDDSLDGMLGNGFGKWRLLVVAEQAIDVLNFIETKTGHLTNMSTVAMPGNAQ